MTALPESTITVAHSPRMKARSKLVDKRLPDVRRIGAPGPNHVQR